MNRLKSYMFIGAGFVFVLGTLLHFAYSWSGNNSFVGLFSPINESTWEHMKLIFFPMLLYSLFTRKLLKEDYPCIYSAFALGLLLGTFLIPVLFYTYSGILGFNVAIVDIATFFISVIIAFAVVYRTTLSCSVNSFKTVLNFLLFLLTVAFIIFSVFPPDIAIFKSPI